MINISPKKHSHERSNSCGGTHHATGGCKSNCRAILNHTRTKLIDKKEFLDKAELREIYELPENKTGELLQLAHDVRLAWCGNTVEIEGIISAKTGACKEDCNFCSQSAKHPSAILPTKFLSNEELLEAASSSKDFGATEFCIVLAETGPSEKTMQRLEEVVPFLKEQTGLNINVSAGILTESQAVRLKQAGVHRYNHNLETSKSFFGNVVTTHSYDQRYDTCKVVKSSGMQLCSGLLFGLGELPLQRIEALIELQSLRPNEVPINFLNPRPGTPLEKQPLVEPIEALKLIAIARLALPNVILRYAGGREITLKHLQSAGMTAGINGLIVGNYLTTLGRSPKEDLDMLEELNMPIGSLSSLF
jgi:biotin synthase